jgi:hypothetical protein
MSQNLLEQIAEYSPDKRVRAVARMANRHMGRPTSLNRVLASRVVGYVLEGNYVETACGAVGISKKTFYNWQNRVAEWTGPEVDWVDVPESERLYVQFFHALKLAEDQAEMKLLRRAAAGEKGWQAAMTVLERKYPTRWGRQEKRIHTGDPEKPVVFQLETDKERRARVARVLRESESLEEEKVEA